MHPPQGPAGTPAQSRPGGLGNGQGSDRPASDRPVARRLEMSQVSRSLASPGSGASRRAENPSAHARVSAPGSRPPAVQEQTPTSGARPAEPEAQTPPQPPAAATGSQRRESPATAARSGELQNGRHPFNPWAFPPRTPGSKNAAPSSTNSQVEGGAGGPFWCRGDDGDARLCRWWCYPCLQSRAPNAMSSTLP